MSLARVTTWILVASNALLAAGIVVVWWASPSPTALMAGMKPPAIVVPALTSAQNKVADYVAVRDQAILYSSRHYVPPPIDRPAIVRPNYTFVAALLKPKNQSIALLRHVASGSDVKLKIGDLLDLWTVTAIDAHSVQLDLDGNTFLIGTATPALPVGVTRMSLSPNARPPHTAPRMLSANGSLPPAAIPTPRTDTSARIYRPPPQ